MSHVTTIDVHQHYEVNVLQRMCKDMGWEWREGQNTYAWYGNHVGDYPLPEGFTREDMGKCNHAIHVPGARYEIGVVWKNGKWQLLWDFWQGGYGLQKAIGKDGGLLQRSYNIVKAGMTAQRHRRRFYERPAQQEGWRKMVVEV